MPTFRKKHRISCTPLGIAPTESYDYRINVANPPLNSFALEAYPIVVIDVANRITPVDKLLRPRQVVFIPNIVGVKRGQPLTCGGSK